MKKILLFIRRINWEVTKKMALQEDVTNALKELRKENVRKFDQSVDLIINLQKFDIKRSAVNLFAFVPNQIKEKKIAAFLEGQSDLIDTITKEDFKKYNDKKVLKELPRNMENVKNVELKFTMTKPIKIKVR